MDPGSGAYRGDVWNGPRLSAREPTSYELSESAGRYINGIAGRRWRMGLGSKLVRLYGSGNWFKLKDSKEKDMIVFYMALRYINGYVCKGQIFKHGQKSK